MLNVLCVIGTFVGIGMAVSFFVFLTDINRDPSLTLLIAGVIIMTVSANGYDYAAKKMKYDTEKNTAKIRQRNELHQKFLQLVKDDKDFEIYFEKENLKQ